MQTLPHDCGIGLRSQHIKQICKRALSGIRSIPYLEVLADDYLTKGGHHLRLLDSIRQDYPISAHCVGLSIGSAQPLNLDYIKQLKAFIHRYEPATVSDHVCWTTYNQQQFHDLLPLPYTKECLTHLTNNLDAIQNALGQQVILENVSSYMTYAEDEMTEASFLKQLCNTSGCKLLLDVNNVYVSAVNHNFDAHDYISQLPIDAIEQYHLAGFEKKDGYLLDAHNSKVAQAVWELFSVAVKLFGAKPTIIEWDNDIPPLHTLLNEAKQAQRYLNNKIKQ